MSNLLLITDVARLRKIFGRLTEDKNIRLRIVNNLEKGGEEIAIEKPDVVFVQTHLSGLSPEILLMHLKKQLGRKRSRFVLLASSAQTNDAALKQYQGWLDTAAEDSQFLSDLLQLLASLLNKGKKNDNQDLQKTTPVIDPTPQPVSQVETSALLERPALPENIAPEPAVAELQHPVIVKETAEPSLEEQGITYAPRQRLKVYSEFTNSFDSAVSNTQEPESLEQTSSLPAHDWEAENIDVIEAKPQRSKKGTFLIWLAPVVIAVVVITYLQQQRATPKAAATPIKTASTAVVVPAAVQPAPVSIPPADVAKAPSATNTAPVAAVQDRLSDKAVLSAIAENRGGKSTAPAIPSAKRLTNLPDFIPRYGLDKQFGAANPGWELYKGQVTEFKVLRESGTIKAIQTIDRGGNGVPESFMKGVLQQVVKNPAAAIETSEKKEGYNIQRGKIADNISVVYYRDEDGGKLRAFVLTWQ